MTCQNWRSEKNPGLDTGPHSSGLRARILFGLPTLTSHSFAAPWVTILKSGSFESPKPYLFVHNLKNSKLPLLTSVRTSWKATIYFIKGVLMILNRTPLYVLHWSVVTIVELFSCTGNFSNFYHYSILFENGCKMKSLDLLTLRNMEPSAKIPILKVKRSFWHCLL